MTRMLAINSYMRPLDYPLDVFVTRAKSAGYAAVGLTARDLDQYGIDTVARIMATSGMEVSSLNSAGYLTYADARTWAEQDARNGSLIDAAVRLNARFLVVITGGHANEGQTLRQARERVEARFPALHARAHAAGVTLAVEPIHPADVQHKGCFNSLADCLALIAPYPDAKVAVDAYHSMWDTGIWSVAPEFWQRVAFVQAVGVRETSPDLKAVRDLLAHDSIGVADWLTHLDGTPFSGLLEFELFDHHRAGRDTGELIDASFLQLLPFAGKPHP